MKMKTLDIYITKKCNLKCHYCYVDINNKKDKEHEDINILFNKINLLEYNHVKFFWWEPLLKWVYIKKLIFFIKNINNKILFTIVTNGLLLNNNKLIFCKKNNINLIISVHSLWVKNIMRNVDIFIYYIDILSFSFIFEISKLDFPYKYIFILQKFWFYKFILWPEVYSDWNSRNLILLKKQLNKLINLFKKNNNIKFDWIRKNKLEKINKWCYKTILWPSGLTYKCNRFKNINKLNNYNDIYDLFSKFINYETDIDKYFFSCPIWWFLDSLKINKDLKDRVLQYKNLNYIFINFYKELNEIQNKNNLLSDKISMFRFNLTNKCNIRCDYCYVNKNNLTLDYNIAKNYIDFYLSYYTKNKVISFFWWEPFMEFNLLKKIVSYTKKEAKFKNKKLKFMIATNFLIIDKEKINFLIENNFYIHISLNGNKKINNLMRDNSTDLLLNNFNKYLFPFSLIKKTTILLAFSNREVHNLFMNIKYIYKLGFKKVNLEIIFWIEYNWWKIDFIILKDQLLKIKEFSLNKDFLVSINKETSFIDISVNWEVEETSFIFHNYQANYKIQELFKKLFKNIFK